MVDKDLMQPDLELYLTKNKLYYAYAQVQYNQLTKKATSPNSLDRSLTIIL